MANTNYTDAQVLKEVMKWKTLFFPQNMISLALQDANNGAPSSGQSASAGSVSNLPGMVGGC